MKKIISDTRFSNRVAVLRILRERPTTRAALARETGLTRAAITNITFDLIHDGMIFEGDVAVSDTAGRKGICLQIDPSSRYAVGISITRKNIEVSLCDLFGRITATTVIEHSKTADETVDEIEKTVRALITKEGKDESKFIGGGICAPGPVDSQNGVILNPVGLGQFENYPIAAVLSEKFGRTFTLERDTNAFAIAEKSFVPERAYLYLLADEGLGSCYVADGAAFHGFGGFGCELGHVGIPGSVKPCRCGNIGCAELYASVQAALEYASERGTNFDSWHSVVSAAEKGDEKAISVVRHEAEMLFSPCVTAVNLFEPDVIILGGMLAEKPQMICDILETKLSAATLTRAYHKVKVRASKCAGGANSGAAAMTVLELFFNGGIKQ